MTMIEVFALHLIEQFPEDRFMRLLDFVDVDKRNRILRFRRWQDAHRTLLADLLVRFIHIQKTGISNETLTFSVNEFGKPMLEGMSDCHFNISHSGEWIVVATDRHPIGVDVEEIRPIDFGVAKRFYSNEEYETLLGKPENQQLDFFYSVWTLKESYIKALGHGLNHPLNVFTIRLEQEIQLVRDQETVSDYYFKTYAIDPNYRLAVCANSNVFADSVHIKNINDICQYFQEIH